MDLELSEDESDLRDNVRAVLASICPPAAVRAVYEGKGDRASIWSRMVELSWPALAIPEQHGGLGLGFVEPGGVAGPGGTPPLVDGRQPAEVGIGRVPPDPVVDGEEGGSVVK